MRFPAGTALAVVMLMMAFVAASSSYGQTETEIPQSTAPVLAPEQRMELIRQKIADSHTQRHGRKLTPEEEAKLRPYTGVLVDEAGAPVGGGVVYVSDAIVRNSVKQELAADGTFSGKVWPGPVTVRAWADGFALREVVFEKGFPENTCRIVLSKGQPYRIQCVNDVTGAPVEGARLTFLSSDETFNPYRQVATTGKDGWATFPHVPPGWVFWLKTTPDGYQSACIEKVNINGPELSSPVRLTPRQPVLLRIREEGTGKPIAGARVTLHQVEPPVPYFDTAWGKDGIETDDKGEALLHGLDPTRKHHLMAETDTHADIFSFRPDESPALELTRDIAPKRTLKVTIRNLPPQDGGKLPLRCFFDSAKSGQRAVDVKLDIRDGTAEFVRTFSRGTRIVLLFLGERQVIPPLQDTTVAVELDYVTIHKRPLDMATVTIRLKPTPGEVMPEGSLKAEWELNQGGSSGKSSSPVIKGKAVFKLPLDADNTLSGDGLTGGRLEEEVNDLGDKARQRKVTNAPETVVPVVPAGLIRAKVLNVESRRICDTIIRVRNLSMGSGTVPSSILRGDYFLRGGEDYKKNGFAEWYASGPVELGTDEYYICAFNGLRYAIGPRFRIDAANPVQDVLVTLPDPRTCTIRLVDEETGKPPVAAPEPAVVRFEADSPVLGEIRLPELRANENGAVTLETNPVQESSVPDAAAIRLDVKPIHMMYQPVKQRVTLDANGEYVVALKRGKQVLGRIVNKTIRTDKEVFDQCKAGWTCSNPETGSWYPYVRMVDAEGRFQFNDVPDARIQIFVNCYLPDTTVTYADESRNASPGGPEFVAEIHDARKQK